MVESKTAAIAREVVRAIVVRGVKVVGEVVGVEVDEVMVGGIVGV